MLINKMEFQHFVPKSYLKHFCFDEEERIFTSKIINHTGNWSIPKSYHLNEICGIDNFYNLDIDTSITTGYQTDFIERNLFWYEHNFIPNILKKIKSGDINFEDKKELSRFYISIKQRNPYHRKSYTKDKVIEILPKFEKEIMEEFLQKDKSIEEINKALLYARSKILNYEDVSKALHNRSILETEFSPSETILNAFSKLISYDLIIFTIENKNQFFIISDNPGFSVDIYNRVHHTKFKDDLFHFLPLTSKIGILFIKPTEPKEGQITIKWRTINDELISKLNYCSGKRINEHLYCENSTFLQNYTQTL